MIECTQNAINQDFKLEYPEPDAHGNPITPAITEIFTMLNTMIDEVVHSKLEEVWIILLVQFIKLIVYDWNSECM
jgi:hypothetical protein